MNHSFHISEISRKNAYLAIGLLVFFDLFVTALTLKFNLLVLWSIISILYVYFSFQHTFFGLCNIILFHVFILKGTGRISYAEIAFGIYFFVVLSGWFFRKYFIEKKQRAIRGVGFFLIGFIALCFFSIVPAFIFRSSLIKWFRELIPFLTYLLFFPLVDTMKNKKHIQIIIFSFFALSLAVALTNFMMYKRAISNAVYFWELMSSRQTANEPLFVTVMTIAAGVLIFSTRKKAIIAAAAIIAFFSIALAITFTRAYWAATAISLLVLMLFVPLKLKIRVISYLLLLAGGATILFHQLFSRVGSFIIQAFEQRLQTLTQMGKDISTLNRIVESEAILSLIKVNPIIGYGLGKTFSFYSLLPGKMPAWYVHNAYLYIIFKIGLVGLLFLMMFYIKSIHNGYRMYKIETDHFMKGLVLGIVALFIAILPLSFSSPQFYQKDTVLVITLGAGMVEAIRRRRVHVGQKPFAESSENAIGNKDKRNRTSI